MAGREITRDGDPAARPPRLVLRAWVAGLHGWGVATPPKWPVHLELRDPGLLVIVRPRRFRSEDVAVTNITLLELHVNATQYSRGGGFIGGGVGIKGAVTGMAIAGAMNRMSRQQWETTHLHVIENHPTGATRRVTLAFPVHTPVRLLEEMAPGVDAWTDEWVRATLAGEIQPFADSDNLNAVYRQIDAITARQMLTDQDAQALASHFTQPLLATLHQRLVSRDVDHGEVQQITTELDRLQDHRRITRQQAAPLRALLAEIPTSEVKAETQVAREQLISELIELRRAGAITETELQTEIARLRHG